MQVASVRRGKKGEDKLWDGGDMEDSVPMAGVSQTPAAASRECFHAGASSQNKR